MRGLQQHHGARQLDTSPPAIEALPRVVEAVEGRAEVYVDGGIRRGTDVVKALALGARAVCVGRPYVWGLAADGQQGVERALEILQTELVRDMQLVGAPDLAAITRGMVV